LTMNRYTHLGLHDEAAALDKLPQIPSGPKTEAAALKATGTEGKATDSSDKLAPHMSLPYTLLTHTAGREGGVARTTDESEGVTDAVAKQPQVLILKGDKGECGRLRTGEEEKAPPGFEPGMADLQSTALPLG